MYKYKYISIVYIKNEKHFNCAVTCGNLCFFLTVSHTLSFLCNRSDLLSNLVCQLFAC